MGSRRQKNGASYSQLSVSAIFILDLESTVLLLLCPAKVAVPVCFHHLLSKLSSPITVCQHILNVASGPLTNP